MCSRVPSSSPSVRRLVPATRLLLATLSVLGVLGVVSIADAPGAAAQGTCGNTDATPNLSVTPTSLSASATSTVTVTATDYLVPPHACGSNVFGGVYVLFGWVAPGGQWGPSWRSSTSSAGQYGTTYSYPGEGGGGDTRDDGSGVVRLVSFTDGGTSGSETPFHMDDDGNWTTTINVRGALFTWTDISTGATNTVDCRAVQCGVFTIGAHGKASRTNELFAPVSFRDDGPAPTVAPGGVTAAPPAASGGGGATAAPGGTGSKAAGGGTTSSGGGATATTAAPVGETTTTIAPVETTAPATSTSGASVEADSEERQVVAGEAAGVQDFGGSGGGSGALVLGLVALALVVGGATAAGWWVRRRRATGPEGI